MPCWFGKLFQEQTSQYIEINIFNRDSRRKRRGIPIAIKRTDICNRDRSGKTTATKGGAPIAIKLMNVFYSKGRASLLLLSQRILLNEILKRQRASNMEQSTKHLIKNTLLHRLERKAVREGVSEWVEAFIRRDNWINITNIEVRNSLEVISNMDAKTTPHRILMWVRI